MFSKLISLLLFCSVGYHVHSVAVPASLDSYTAPHNIPLVGRYTWELLLDIDNTNNSGEIRREFEVKTSISTSYKEMRRSVINSKEGVSMELNLGGTLFEIIKAEVKGAISAELQQTYEQLTEKQSDFSQETTKKDVYTVGPHSKLTLYRLIFHGPGVNQLTDTISSTPHNMSDVVVDVTVKKIPVLERIDVVYTDDAVSAPRDMIEVVKGDNGDINAGFKGKYVWLVPKYTTEVQNAATGLVVAIQGSRNDEYKDLAAGAGGDYRYIKTLKDPNNKERITRVGLVRSSSAIDASTLGWNYRTIDINQGRKGDFLYVVYNTQSIANYNS